MKKKSKLYEFFRLIVVKLCYRFYFLDRLKHSLRTLISIYDTKKTQQRLIDLDKLIKQAVLKGQGIFIQFPVIPWSGCLFQRPQQLALAMSKLNYLTIYLTPSAVDPYLLEEVFPQLYVTSQYDFLKDLKGAIISVYITYPDYLKSYLTKDLFLNNHVFYEYVDRVDEAICGKFLASLVMDRFAQIKQQAFECMIGTSRSLYQELLEKYPDRQVTYLPNGVDLMHYQHHLAQRHCPIVFPHAFKQALTEKRKIIGYFGAIASWIWDELVIYLADQRPDYRIVMIGPYYGDRKPFPDRKNIIWVGPVNYDALPYYGRYFDVSIIPFRLGEIAKTTSPLKLFEYFALGKPIVVTSDLIECTSFEGVESANTPETFVEKVDKAIGLSHDSKLQSLYARYAEENSWMARAKQLQAFFPKTVT